MPIVFNEAARSPFRRSEPRRSASQHLSPSNQLLTIKPNPCRATLEVLAFSPAREAAVQPVLLFVSRFSAGRLLMRNWLRFVIFRIGSQMASFRKSRPAKAAPKLRMSHDCSCTGAGYVAVAPRWRQAVDYEVVITNWLRFAIFRIDCQMASFRKSRAAKTTPKLRIDRTIVLHCRSYATVAPQCQQAADYESVNHKLASFRHFPHRPSNGFVSQMRAS